MGTGATVKDLMTEAAELGVAGRSKMRKAELQAAIAAAKAAQQPVTVVPPVAVVAPAVVAPAMPVEVNMVTQKPLSAYLRFCKFLGWRDPILWGVSTAGEVFLGTVMLGGIKMLYGPEIALGGTVFLGLLAWVLLSGMAGARAWVPSVFGVKISLRWTLYLVIVLIRGYFGVAKVEHQLTETDSSGAALEHAMDGFTRTVQAVMSHEKDAREARAAVEPALEAYEMEKINGGCKNRCIEKRDAWQQLSTRALALEAAINDLKPLTVVPTSDKPEAYYRQAMVLVQACPKEWCGDMKVSRADFVLGGGEIVITQTYKNVMAGKESAMVALVAVLLLDAIVLISGLMVEIIPSKRRDQEEE